MVLERRRRAEATVHSTGEGNGCIFCVLNRKKRNETFFVWVAGCSRYLNFYFSFSFCYCYFCAPFLPVLSWTAGCFSRGVVTVMGESVE